MTGQAPLRAAAEALAHDHKLREKLRLLAVSKGGISGLSPYEIAGLADRLDRVIGWLEAALATPPGQAGGRLPTPAELHAAMLEAIEVRMGAEAGTPEGAELDALADAAGALERAMPEFLTDDTAAFQAAADAPLEEVRESLVELWDHGVIWGAGNPDEGKAERDRLIAELLDLVASPRDAIRRALDAAYELGWDARDAGTTDVAAAQVRRAASEVRLSELLDSVAPER